MRAAAGPIRLFVFGFGYSARAVVERMRAGIETTWGTTRDSRRWADLTTLGVRPLMFNSASPAGTLDDNEQSMKAALAASDHVLVSIPPGVTGDPVLQCFGGSLAALKPRSLIYLSTIGVYGDHGGAWVDEETPCRPVSDRSRQRVAAESAWRQFGQASGVPVAIIRLAGIYGPGRGPFEKIRRGTARRIVKPGQVFNRIHVDDIAAIVEAAFDHRASGVFNATDDEPAPPQDVLAYAAKLLDIAAPPEIAYSDADMTPMARSFYAENKRVRNERMKRDLGVRLGYPTYREGLAAVLAAEPIENGD